MTSDTLSELMAQAARELEQQDSPEATMRTAVEVAVQDIDGAEAAGLSLVIGRRRVETLAATSAQARRADELQYELAEGPCLEAVWEERVVHGPDLESEGRWPRWARAMCSETDYRSIMAFQLFTTADRVGALNVYSTAPHGFDAGDRDHGLALSAHIAVAVRAAQQVEQLQTALDSRTVIAQAVGILMERHDMRAESAFSVLARVSSTTNRKVRDVAADLCSTGRLPGLRSDRTREDAGPRPVTEEPTQGTGSGAGS